MESKLSMIMSENENSSLILQEEDAEGQVSNIIHKPNNKANKVRTCLLVEVNKDNMSYLRNSTVMLNSEFPKDIIKKFDQFEKKFDNPLILGSLRRGNRTNSAILDKNSSELLTQKIKNSNINLLKSNEENYAENEYNYNINLIDKCVDHNPLDFAEFLEKKKISLTHKKIKINQNENFRTQNSKKSKKKLADISYLSQYSNIYENSIVGINSTNNISNNFNSLSYNSFNSNNKNFSFLINFLNEEERRKLKILEGYDKLRGTAKQIAPLQKRENIKVHDPNIRQYEELFELLEYKGINFKSNSDVENLYLHKIRESKIKLHNSQKSQTDVKLKKEKKKDKNIACSSSPKTKSKEKICVDNAPELKEKNSFKKVDRNCYENNLKESNLIPTSNQFSAKKNSVPINSNNPYSHSSNKPPRMSSDQKSINQYHKRCSSPISKISQEINEINPLNQLNSKIQKNYTSSNNQSSLTSLNKFVYERHPNSVSPKKKKIQEHEIFSKIEEPLTSQSSQNLIDYDNYRNNLNTSVIQVKDDEQEDTSVIYENQDSYISNSNFIITNCNAESKYNFKVINLKSGEIMSNNTYNRDFSSLSQIVYTSGDVQEFSSNVGTANQNFMTGMTGDYTSCNFRTKHLSNNTHVIDNYEEYENLMNKMQTNNLTENSLYNNIRSNYSDNTMTNNNESEFITNSVNTSLSNNSNITKSLSYISKSSGEFDI